MEVRILCSVAAQTVDEDEEEEEEEGFANEEPHGSLAFNWFNDSPEQFGCRCNPNTNRSSGGSKIGATERPGNNRQTPRDKVFPPENTKVDQQAVGPVPVPPKRKERLISSLVADTPRISTRSETHTRKLYPTRRSIPPLDCSQSVQETEKEEKDCRERLHSLETPKKDAPCTAQNCEEEAAKTGSDIPAAPPVLPDLPRIERSETRETEDNGNENQSNPAASGSRPLRKSQRVKKKETVVVDVNTPARSVVAANTKSDIRGVGFWFSLVASNKERYAHLPQIAKSYLRGKYHLNRMKPIISTYVEKHDCSKIFAVEDNLTHYGNITRQTKKN